MARAALWLREYDPRLAAAELQPDGEDQSRDEC